MEVEHLKDLLNEIDLTIEALEASQKEYLLPDTGNPGNIIREYLGHQDNQRAITLQLDDLKALRDSVQDKLEKIEAARLEEQRRKEAAKQEKSTQTEIAKLVKRLTQLEPTSPEATRTLQKLSNLRKVTING